MNSKLKQSIAVQRQIPEHVRENYPLFVEFIRLYYDYLQDTQAQDLEGIRDIDTTLDEFIDNFKSELSKNLPIDLAQDRRFLIKHLKEFYLSRGSESSFKFLFRTLFAKEAEIFYPSTQVLRVSDGQWKQDVSIFVKMSGSTTTLFPLNGKFITITTSRKTITTFVENVTEYTSTIFEIFIKRDYINEIEIGSVVSLTEGNTTYTGTILECPTKISIYKPGAGFKVGDLYALKTSLGDGCVVKITKTGSLGEIKAIQVVSFGLDYKSKFYSYLSSKDISAYEYIHPLKLVSGTTGSPATAPGYTPGDPAYNERSGGFIEAGFATKQTYFYYDESIPVGSADRASDRFFAEPSYVGDIVEQFYADETEQVIDQDLAIIEVSLGAVAKYPGYYLTANGFISDEMYIHDGEYYQAFSYVVKVEEELRKYADILKSLIHPAGMRVYSEYNIFKQLKVSFVAPALARILQFTDNEIQSDVGFNYNAYIGSFNNDFEEMVIDGVTRQLPIITYEKTENAGQVFSQQSKAATFPTKFIPYVVTQFSAIRDKFVDKAISELIDTLDPQAKFVDKPIVDANTPVDGGYNYDAYSSALVNGETIITPTGSPVYSTLKSAQYIFKPLIDQTLNNVVVVKAVFKDLLETINNSEHIEKFVEKPLLEDILNSDLIVKLVDKAHTESLESPDSIVKLVEKYLIETITYDEHIAKLVEKALEDFITSPTDSVAKLVDKALVETITNSEEIVKLVEKALTETVNANELISKLVDKALTDLISSPTDLVSKLVHKAITDLIASPTDGIDTKLVEKAIVETIIQSETISKLFETGFDDTIVSPSDLISKLVDKAFADLITSPTDGINNKLVEKTILETVTESDFIVSLVEKTIIEFINANEIISKLVERGFADTLTMQDIETTELIKILVESINKIDSLSNENTKSFDTYLNEPTADISDIQTIKKIEDTPLVEDSFGRISFSNFLENILNSDGLEIIRVTLVEDILDAIELYSNGIDKPLFEDITYTDQPSNIPEKKYDEIISSPTDVVNYVDKAKTIIESIVNSEVINSYTEKTQSEPITINEAIDKLVEKIVLEFLNSSDIYSNQIDKTYLETILNSDSVTNLVDKILYESITSPTDSLDYKNIQKTILETINANEGILKALDRAYTENITIQEIISIIRTLLTDEFISIIDGRDVLPIKQPSETLPVSDLYNYNNVEKAILETININEVISKLFVKPISDTLSSPTDISSNLIQKTIAESATTIADALSNALSKFVTNENISVNDTNGINIERIKQLNETITLEDILNISRALVFEDVISSITDGINKSPSKTFDDTSTVSQTGFINEPIKQPTDSINTTMVGRVTLAPYDAEVYFELFSDYQISTTIS